ncbi:unnamed protein product [Rotaria sp. Silwood1]|nr:unnamed protein product [Rotaria sp. Silwood1]CAF5028460.1 unnamed protein product [Rotaria sp. Silwood1]
MIQLPLRAPGINIHPNARWQQNGLTVAGGFGGRNGNNQLSYPYGLYIDDDQTIYVADTYHHRIMEWKYGATSGQVVAGGNGAGNGTHHDWVNQRVVRWPRRNGARGETIISNIDCRVRRYRIDDTEGIVVAGGNGCGKHLDQLCNPECVCVDRDHSVYVSEWGNRRVMKWKEGAKEGIVVAGGQGSENSLKQLNGPNGVVVDQSGTVYVADEGNHRIMRWPKGATQGSVIAGDNGPGTEPNQYNFPYGLLFDRHGNLYVSDNENHRIQKFNIEQTTTN